MNLKILDDTFSVVKFLPTATIPTQITRASFYSVMRTNEELSVVCPTSLIGDNDDFIDAEHHWKCLKVVGELDFNLTGILASLANPLAESKISIFALSTYNTDYLLIKNDMIDKAKDILEKAGHTFLKEDN